MQIRSEGIDPQGIPETEISAAPISPKHVELQSSAKKIGQLAVSSLLKKIGATLKDSKVILAKRKNIRSAEGDKRGIDPSKIDLRKAVTREGIQGEAKSLASFEGEIEDASLEEIADLLDGEECQLPDHEKEMIKGMVRSSQNILSQMEIMNQSNEDIEIFLGKMAMHVLEESTVNSLEGANNIGELAQIFEKISEKLSDRLKGDVEKMFAFTVCQDATAEILLLEDENIIEGLKRATVDLIK